MTLKQKEHNAISVLRNFEPKDGKGYYLCYSGGKDSDCIRILAALAGVKHECKHNLTTVDAPETVYYVRKTIGKENIEQPPLTMWQLIPKMLFPPTRIVRYCCEQLKERGGRGRLKITGVRKSESVARSKRSDLIQILGKPKTTQKAADDLGVEYRINNSSLIMNMDNDSSRRLVESCYRTNMTMLNPIIDWTDQDVWDFLHFYNCESNPLYQCGKRRIGCIGCPMQGGKGMKTDFAFYPKYRENYVKAFDRMLENRKKQGLVNHSYWETGEDVMRWWVGDNPLQITLDDYEQYLQGS